MASGRGIVGASRRAGHSSRGTWASEFTKRVTMKHHFGMGSPALVRPAVALPRSVQPGRCVPAKQVAPFVLDLGKEGDLRNHATSVMIRKAHIYSSPQTK